jgi:hypothetical protein
MFFATNKTTSKVNAIHPAQCRREILIRPKETKMDSRLLMSGMTRKIVLVFPAGTDPSPLVQVDPAIRGSSYHHSYVRGRNGESQFFLHGEIQQAEEG